MIALPGWNFLYPIDITQGSQPAQPVTTEPTVYRPTSVNISIFVDVPGQVINL
jgi:hypothetical protein